MFGQVNSQLKITQTVYSDDEFSSIKRLADARQAEPELINSFANYVYGSVSDYSTTNFPIMFYTNGMNRKRSIRSTDGTFKANMYGRPRKTSRVLRTLTYENEAEIGKNFAPFKLVFEDRWFQLGQTLRTGNLPGYNARVQAIEKDSASKGFVFTLQLITNDPNAVIPVSMLTQGRIWSGGSVNVALMNSKGTEHRSQSHFSITNQLSRVRHSYNWAGNVANKVLKIEYSVPGKSTFKTWTEWEMYRGELEALEKCEDSLIFDTYNRDAQGIIRNTDENGEVVPFGMGMWQQIINEMNYGQLTEKKLDDFFQSVFYNADMLGDNRIGNSELVIVGGTGLMMQIDAAMKRAVNKLTLVQSSDLFVRGGSSDLEYGGYFTSYRHRSGRIIKFVEHPLFNRGVKADSMDRHPLYPNMSLLSFCGMVLDFTTYTVDTKINAKGSEANIMYLYEEGVEYQDWYVLGGSKVPSIDMASVKYRATDVDKSSYHVMKSQGVHIMYPGTCAKIICDIS